MRELNSVVKAALTYLGFRALAIIALIGISEFRGISFTHIFQRWDAQWYRRIAENGYGDVVIASDGRHLADYAFFPLFPMVERYLHQLTGLSFIASGVLISAVASVLAACGIYKVVRNFTSERIALFAVALWAILPISNVENLAYSESLFTALAAWSLYFCLKKYWIIAAILATLAGLTRPTALAVALAIIVAAAIELKKNPWSKRALLSILIAPMGWIFYIAWVGNELGKWNGYFAVTHDWGNSIDGGYSFAIWIIKFFMDGNFISGILVLAAIFGLYLLLATLWKIRIPSPLLVYTYSIAFLALITSGYFGSKPRYLLPVFPLLLPISYWLNGKVKRVGTFALCTVAILSATYGAIWLTGSGPL